MDVIDDILERLENIEDALCADLEEDQDQEDDE